MFQEGILKGRLITYKTVNNSKTGGGKVNYPLV